MANEHLNPAKSIIGKLGGPEPVASVTGRSLSRVYRWMYPAERGGTGGVIPQRYHRALLEAARAKGIPLSADDLLPAASIEAAQ